jgi:cell division control protein 12
MPVPPSSSSTSSQSAAALAKKTGKPGVASAISSAVGISNLPNQRHRIVSKRGVDFTILVCGESGLGKSTFISNLITLPIIHRKESETRFNISNVTRTVTPRIYQEVLEEKGFIVRLGVIDTPGFGDFVNNNNWYCILEGFRV